MPEIIINLSPDQAGKFLDDLSDDAYRAKLQADPIGALAEHGIKVPVDLKPPLKVPEKSAIESLRTSEVPLSPGRVLFGDCFVYATAVMAQTIAKPSPS